MLLTATLRVYAVRFMCHSEGRRWNFSRKKWCITGLKLSHTVLNRPWGAIHHGCASEDAPTAGNIQGTHGEQAGHIQGTSRER
jgi:hypothetical protein